ncbi:MAG TPA: dihydrolipoamide acetyltransferase family protein [Candidatus Binataceae bacterium]|nr:dihydrolipoamide acetyltransferase family protein [Candidatus Binataceae bacterium]
MAVEVTMPQMGESVVEGTITKWLVKEGDTVAEDQSLVEISTDKVDTEIPSPSAGVISKLVASEGETLPVGAVLAVIDNTGASKVATVAPRSKPDIQPPPAKPREEQVQTAPATARRLPQSPPTPPEAIAATSAEQAKSSPVAETASTVAVQAAGDEHRRYSPVVIKIAAEHGLDVNRIPGTGLGGRVSKRDVLKYLDSLRQGGPATPVATPPASQPQASHANGAAAVATPARPAPSRPPTPSLPTPATGGGYHPPIYEPREGDIVEPFTRRRKLIAEHMVFSKTHSPHVGTLAEVDLTKLSRLRETHKRAFLEHEGFALTMLPLAAAATVRALKEFPRMNSSVAADAVIIRKQINLGIAMDSDEGLLVPVIKAAESMSVTGLAREMERLHKKVQEKKIAPDDLSGGSFTLSNPGREGNLFGFAIINQPQVGILRMGEVKKRPVVIDVEGTDAIAIRTMMYLALSYDHRVIDGVLGNSFLFRVARILEEADFEL